MEYQKKNLLDDTSNQIFKCKARNWVELNDESRETYNANTDIKLRTSMIRSYSSGYSDAYIHVKETITILNTAAAYQ